ncbi:hypothetical protein CWR48_16810 [Oceanobacillus arenosus]|uniref:Uncharacterized protein n=1 Tax=Oceanobacillus arenosus TaxID=1229153 RepID=A0A3D8PLE1_9BACI|nr:hypothetical protein CWR48_16810 [Oceanobacillus arenosus]
MLQSTSIVRGFVILLTLDSALPPAEKIHEDSCGKKSLGETLKCDSTKRLTSSPRKAKCIFGAVDQVAKYHPKLVRTLNKISTPYEKNLIFDHYLNNR